MYSSNQSLAGLAAQLLSPLEILLDSLISSIASMVLNMIIDLVSIFHKSVKILLEAIENEEKVRDWFETTAEEISHWESADNNT